MERYGKIAVPGAVVGLVLSVLAGLLAGVGLGTVILRGVISAVVMGAGSAGLYAAAERLLPGVAGGDPAAMNTEYDDDTGREDIAPAPGGQLNIVVEDEEEDERGAEDAPAETDGVGQPDEVGQEPEPVEAEALSEADGATENLEPAEGEGRDGESGNAETREDAESVEAPPVKDALPVSDGGEDDEVDDDLIEEIEEQSADDAEAVMNQAIAEEKYGGGVEIDDSVLDEMPDIGSFSGSFGSENGVENADDGGGGFSGQPSGGSGRQSAGGAAGNDPAQIAKALKTMLSRDGKE